MIPLADRRSATQWFTLPRQGGLRGNIQGRRWLLPCASSIVIWGFRGKKCICPLKATLHPGKPHFLSPWRRLETLYFNAPENYMLMEMARLGRHANPHSRLPLRLCNGKDSFISKPYFSSIQVCLHRWPFSPRLLSHNLSWINKPQWSLPHTKPPFLWVNAIWTRLLRIAKGHIVWFEGSSWDTW